MRGRKQLTRKNGIRNMKNEIVEKVRAAGVVGAGGAGFPTHVKLNAKADWVLVNGASCEPLLMTDPYLLEMQTSEVLEGLRLVMRAVGAEKGAVCLKGKHAGAMEAVRRAVADMEGVSLFELEDFYPAGDEHVLVNVVTGRTVPEAGIPLAVGVVVSNVESLLNVALAQKGRPVTHRYLTVAGEVKNPCMIKAQIGCSAGDVIAAAGGPVTASWRVVDGGPMMGRVLSDVSAPVTKTTSGLLVLPADHNVVAGKVKDPATLRRLANIGCCQCTLCTELCPRYLLGHNLHPHKLMRQLGALGEVSPEYKKEALLCSECGICEKFACPMMISPREVNAQLKKELAAQGVRWEFDGREMAPSDKRAMRRVPTARLMERLRVAQYAGHPKLLEGALEPERVAIPLRQHIGAPAMPLVKAGDKVSEGQLIAEIPQDALGARIHASISGSVNSVDNDAIIICRS